MSRFHTILKHTFKIALKVFPRAVNLTFVTYCLCKLSTSVCHTFNVLFMTGLIFWLYLEACGCYMEKVTKI